MKYNFNVEFLIGGAVGVLSTLGVLWLLAKSYEMGQSDAKEEKHQ